MTHSEEKPKTTRRNFLTRVLTGWLILTFLPAIYAIVQYIVPPMLREQMMQMLNVGKFSDIPTGEARIVRFNKKAIILIKTEEYQIRALSAVCTHLGCIVDYRPSEKLFKCNCHGSVFDLTGKNIAGPAPRPLQPYRTELKDDNIIVTQF